MSVRCGVVRVTISVRCGQGLRSASGVVRVTISVRCGVVRVTMSVRCGQCYGQRQVWSGLRSASGVVWSGLRSVSGVVRVTVSVRCGQGYHQRQVWCGQGYDQSGVIRVRISVRCGQGYDQSQVWCGQVYDQCQVWSGLRSASMKEGRKQKYSEKTLDEELQKLPHKKPENSSPNRDLNPYSSIGGRRLLGQQTC